MNLSIIFNGCIVLNLMAPQVHGDHAVNLCLLWDMDLYDLMVLPFVCMFNCGKGSVVHQALSIHQPYVVVTGCGTVVGISVPISLLPSSSHSVNSPGVLIVSP